MVEGHTGKAARADRFVRQARVGSRLILQTQLSAGSDGVPRASTGRKQEEEGHIYCPNEELRILADRHI